MDNATPGAQYLTFALAEQVFAMDITSVREIIQVGPITPVPLMPGFVRGIINLRGAVVPVIDLNARLGHGAAQIGKKSCIVIFDVQRDGDTVVLGLLVDAVSEVLEIAADAIEPPPAFGGTLRRELVRGIGKVGARFVVVLAAEKALDVDQMAALCDATHAAA